MTGWGWLLIVGVALTVELALAVKRRELLSEWVWRKVQRYPVIAFLAGVLCGHLFWPSAACLELYR